MRAEIQAQIAAAAGDAMRTLAFAHADLPPTSRRTRTRSTPAATRSRRGLVFVGFVGHPRPAARRREGGRGRSAAPPGIEVKMITGDNVETARAIGREIGLLDAPGRDRHDARRVQRS